MNINAYHLTDKIVDSILESSDSLPLDDIVWMAIADYLEDIEEASLEAQE